MTQADAHDVGNSSMRARHCFTPAQAVNYCSTSTSVVASDQSLRVQAEYAVGKSSIECKQRLLYACTSYQLLFYINTCCTSLRGMGRRRSVRGLPSTMPHGMVETPRGIDFSFLFFQHLSQHQTRACVYRLSMQVALSFGMIEPIDRVPVTVPVLSRPSTLLFPETPKAQNCPVAFPVSDWSA